MSFYSVVFSPMENLSEILTKESIKYVNSYSV